MRFKTPQRSFHFSQSWSTPLSEQDRQSRHRSCRDHPKIYQHRYIVSLPSLIIGFP